MYLAEYNNRMYEEQYRNFQNNRYQGLPNMKNRGGQIYVFQPEMIYLMGERRPFFHSVAAILNEVK